jgi:hypothetical protein
MQKALDLLEGKKSYIVAFLTALLGLLQAFGVVIPEWLLFILAGLGIGTLRHAVSKLPQPPAAP